jgi:primosomal protein N' (replication factor Y)
MCTIGEVFKGAYASSKSSQKKPSTRQLNKIKKRIEKIEAELSEKLEESKELCLSDAQDKALSEIKEGFNAKKPVLLQGVTGSGKTEIYLTLARESLSQGKNVLYLVPEIALSRQLEQRLTEAFGESGQLLIYHSAKTLAARKEVAESIRRHQYICLGTRSSLFLPHRNIGLIIVDEEHDTSYKQDQPAPRYNGRDAALMLGQIHGAKVLLGTATPSLESQYNAETGRFAKVTLTERFYHSEDAEVEIIDTIAERRKRGMNGSFSRKLILSIEKTLASGGQVAILRSRRSYSPVMQCQECGFIPKCPKCSVSLSLHNTGELLCHHCGYRLPYLPKCPKCSGELKGMGAGTQKIEEEASILFPNARVARIDSDTAQYAGRDSETIRGFAEGEIDILIGTQILTKGFDFSGLALVAVIQTDSLLGLQDFRADEKALQLLEQFKGRCGRRNTRGKLIIQTSMSEHPVYKHISGEAQIGDNLMLERKQFSYPPFTRIINVIIKDSNEPRLELLSSKLEQEIERLNINHMGPYTPPVGKFADTHIRIIRLNLAKDRQLSTKKAALKAAIRNFEKAKKYTDHITLDVDPQ